MIRHKGVKHVKKTDDISIILITMRKPKHQSYIRRRMWWASCYKWDMAIYRKEKLSL